MQAHGARSLSNIAQLAPRGGIIDAELPPDHAHHGAGNRRVAVFACDGPAQRQQTVFSRVTGVQGNTGTVNHGRVFQNNQQTTGSPSIAQDDGFSAWIDANPGRSVDLELGFTRSLVYNLNAVSFNIGINLGQLYRKTV